MTCEDFETLPLGSKITDYLLNPVFTNTWQPPNGDFWGSKFVLANGIPYDGGFAEIVKAGRAGGTGQGVMINNMNLCFSAGFGQVLKQIRFAFGEYGGNLNLMINRQFIPRQFIPFSNFRDLDGKTIAGVKVNVLSGGYGNDAGEIEFTGEIKDQRWWGQLSIGGQELWIDNLCWK